jgi:hypothetical protein
VPISVSKLISSLVLEVPELWPAPCGAVDVPALEPRAASDWELPASVTDEPSGDPVEVLDPEDPAAAPDVDELPLSLVFAPGDVPPDVVALDLAETDEEPAPTALVDCDPLEARDACDVASSSPEAAPPFPAAVDPGSPSTTPDTELVALLLLCEACDVPPASSSPGLVDMTAGLAVKRAPDEEVAAIGLCALVD